MTIDEIVDAEIAILKPQFSRSEWFALQHVIRVSLTRVATIASRL